MAFETQGRDAITRVAGANLSTHQYKGVAINTSGTVVLPAAGGQCLGVLQNKPASGKPASIMRDGITKMKSGDVIATPGLEVTVDNTGRAVTATTGDFVIGVALLAAAAADLVISVALGTEHKKAA